MISEEVNLSFQDVQTLIDMGTQSYALGNYEESAEKFALAIEIQVNSLGQYADENAETFYLYGRALLATAVIKNTVLGEPVEKPEEPSASTDTDQKFSFAEYSDEEEDLEDEGKQLNDIDIPQADDLELAWENLDVARLIFSNQKGDDKKLRLADVHLALGDVSLESENFDQAVKDYNEALNIKLQISPDACRELAEAHFKLGLALEYSEQVEDAIIHVQAAMDALMTRLNLTKTDVEKVELKGFLSEMQSKLTDLNTLLLKEEQGESIAQPPKVVQDQVVKDVSSLVKKRKVDVAEPIPEKKAKAV